ncbi:MAG: ATP-binding cassette domain-containing protein [Opitutaceae bacterium]|nr:ATP-binding cassette domain-containing protein [Opitutaceae bacterium]
MSIPFLSIQEVRKSFGSNVVLDGMDLRVERGSITTIMGKSGIGKSVLLKCIAGIHAPDSGQILIDGRRCLGAQCGPDGPRLSYLFQGNALFDSLTAVENVALPLIETTRTRPRVAYRQALKLFEQLDLGDIATKYPSQISGGMQKRVALARALITRPQLILFDEPTAGLDPQRKNSVFTMVADYRKRFDFTALMVSHDIPEALFVSDRVAWMDRGQIRFSGAPTDLELARDPNLLEFIHHRNELLSDLAGQQGRTALFAQWPELRRSYDHFVVASCETERRRPGSDLGLRRFASYQAAVAAITQLPQKHSQLYFLDERHFGFGLGGSDVEALTAEVDDALKVVNAQTAQAYTTRYRWSSRTYRLADVPNPASLWILEDQAAVTVPNSPA